MSGMFSLRAPFLQGFLCMDVPRKKASNPFKTHLYLNGHPRDYNSRATMKNISEKMEHHPTLCHSGISSPPSLVSPSHALNSGVEREVMGTPYHQVSCAFHLPVSLLRWILLLSDC